MYIPIDLFIVEMFVETPTCLASLLSCCGVCCSRGSGGGSRWAPGLPFSECGLHSAPLPTQTRPHTSIDQPDG